MYLLIKEKEKTQRTHYASIYKGGFYFNIH